MSATTSTRTITPTTTARSLWPTALVAGAVAAAATTAVAGVAHAAGVSLDLSGKPIPVLGFALPTFVFAMVGLVIAVGIRRWASDPHRAWIRITLALTALSFVPDLLTDASVATKLTLMLTHVVAATIVIPAVASRFERR